MDDTPQGRILDKMEANLGDLQRELIIEKITHSMRDMSRRGVLPKKCSYGWKIDPVTKVRTRVEEEQVAIERIREFVRLHPEVKIGTMVHILNDPANGIPPHNRSSEGKEGAWYYSALKNLLIREKIPHPKVVDKIKAIEEKKDYTPYIVAKEAARIRGTRMRALKEQENGALAVRIAEILTENPGISHTDVAKALVSEGIELDSKRVIDNNLVTRLIKKERLVEGKDPSSELNINYTFYYGKFPAKTRLY